MSKPTKILIGVLVLLGIVYAIQRLTFTTSTTENSNPFSKLDTSKISQISIASQQDRSGKNQVVIARESHDWFIINPIRFPANRGEVSLLLSAIASNPSASTVADNLTDSLAYGLSETAPVLKISESDRNEISLRVGTVTPDFDGCYVEINGNKKILDLTKNLRTFAAQSLINWRDKRIFDFTFEDLQAADFALGDTLYHFFHRDTLWQINGVKISEAKVREVIGDFIGTMALDFVDTTLSGETSLVDYGFSLSNGTRIAGKVMNLAGQEYVSNTAADQVYLVSNVLSNNLEDGLRGIKKDR